MYKKASMTESYSLHVRNNNSCARTALGSTCYNTQEATMKINGLFIFIATAVVFASISTSQSTDVKIRRRDENGICEDNNDCYQHEKCVEKKCAYACENINCGNNSWCNVENHEATCNCWENFVGDPPNTECVQKKCTINDECRDYEKCENNQCVDACMDVPCGNTTRCKSVSHEGYCVCMFGLVGDPATGCGRRNCSASSECHFYEKCENNECIDACEGTKCGVNAWCEVKDHSATCTCPNKHTGDPNTECIRQNCTEHIDCYEHEKCESNSCVPACDSVTCGENAWCTVRNHIGQCKCEFRLTGDPLVKCTKKECTSDSDCSNSEYCDSHICTQACDNVLCGPNAFCDAKNHTASCVCMEKYTEDPQTGCVREGCTVSEDCLQDEHCEGDKCVPICGPSVCGKNFQCEVKDRIAHCSCGYGLTANPLIGCVHDNCTTNADCSDSKRCENKKCIDACDDIFCPYNTICKAQDHATICACFEKHDGDAYSGCVRQGCSVNNDCFEYETCKDNKCIPACDSVNCEDNTMCNVQDHVAVCTHFDDWSSRPLPGPYGGKHFPGYFRHTMPPAPAKPMSQSSS